MHTPGEYVHRKGGGGEMHPHAPLTSKTDNANKRSARGWQWRIQRLKRRFPSQAPQCCSMKMESRETHHFATYTEGITFIRLSAHTPRGNWATHTSRLKQCDGGAGTGHSDTSELRHLCFQAALRGSSAAATTFFVRKSDPSCLLRGSTMNLCISRRCFDRMECLDISYAKNPT